MEDKAAHFWDGFYKQNKNKFFKDRHWFEQEFPVLKTVGTILEVGCGTGSSIYPLLSLNESVHVYACDFAKSAVDLVLEHPDYKSGRVDAFVADLTVDILTQRMPEGSIDACLMIFVLSAISPSRMLSALVNINSVLKEGGIVCFRDYSFGDLAQKRLDTRGRARKIEENFFARGDGTRAYFFTEDILVKVFKQANFEPVSVDVISKFETNRKLGVSRDRKYVQAVFKKMRTVDDIRSIMQTFACKTREHPDPSTICEDCFLGTNMQIGVLKVAVGDIHIVEETLIEYIHKNRREIAGCLTIELSTQIGSGATTFAALNYSNRHIVVASSRTSKLLSKVFRANEKVFLCERLRVIPDGTWDEQTLLSLLPSGPRKFLFLALSGIHPEISEDLKTILRIALLDRENTRIVVSCFTNDAPQVLERAHQCSLQPTESGNGDGLLVNMQRGGSIQRVCILVFKL